MDNKRCIKYGHKWRQKVWGVLGYDVCARRKCDAERTNPRALLPWDKDYSKED
jgi:hypothetical protein